MDPTRVINAPGKEDATSGDRVLLTAVFKNVDAARANKKFTTYMQNLW